jgi:hypothetical protein
VRPLTKLDTSRGRCLPRRWRIRATGRSAFRFHPSLNVTTPTRMTSAATARYVWNGSPSRTTPISAANTTEVSRKAATAAIGAWVIAQITTA